MVTTILIIFALVMPVIAIACWVLIKSAHGEENKPTVDVDQVESSSVSTQEQSQTKPTEPMNGDPSVLSPTDGNATQKPPQDSIEPKFNVGDRITDGVSVETVMDIKPNGYLLAGAPPLYLPFTDEDKWELSEKDQEEDTNRLQDIFNGVADYFREVVDIDHNPKTHAVLFSMWDECYAQATAGVKASDHIYVPENFPQIISTEGDNDNPLVLEQMCAMLFYQVLAEVMPENRNELARLALNYTCENKTQPLYGWLFYSDPSYARIMAAIIAAQKHNQQDVDAMRKELGTKPIEYKNDISELWLNLTEYMPPAPGPYLDAYKNRKEIPAGEKTWNGNLYEDHFVDEFVAGDYSLDSSEGARRQRTIQAIANKEYRVQHLFGDNRTVIDPQYGEMTFSPVFGETTIGIKISDKGAIATLADAVGMACSNSRKPLLNAEYGRRRPGQGESDPSPANEPICRALVNEPIENGDGHSTGAYDKSGDYVFDDGTHVGNYVTYYQWQLYANSYPSGHSTLIIGVTLSLIEVMPLRTDRLMQAMGWFRLSRCLTRYHHLSDTTIGLLCGILFMPILRACKNVNLPKLVEDAKAEYKQLISAQ